MFSDSNARLATTSCRRTFYSSSSSGSCICNFGSYSSVFPGSPSFEPLSQHKLGVSDQLPDKFSIKKGSYKWSFPRQSLKPCCRCLPLLWKHLMLGSDPLLLLTLHREFPSKHSHRSRPPTKGVNAQGATTRATSDKIVACRNNARMKL